MNWQNSKMKEQITFSDGSAWCSLFVLQSDLLQRHQVVRQLTAPFKYCGVGSLNATRNARSILLNKHEYFLHCQTQFQIFLTSPSLSSLMYVSNLPKPISDWGKDKVRIKHRLFYSAINKTTFPLWTLQSVNLPFPQQQSKAHFNRFTVFSHSGTKDSHI